MKKKIILLACLLSLSLCRAQKIAWVNFDSLVRMMPEAKTVREESEKYMKELTSMMMEMQKETDKKISEYMSGKEKMQDDEKRLREQELQMLQSKMEDFRAAAEKEYQAKRYELAAPLIDKAKKGIEAVARENGYRFVFDVNGTMIYGDPSADILSQSKKKLDGMPVAKIPGSATAKETPKEEKPKTK